LLLQCQDAISNRLIIMDNIELAFSTDEPTSDALTECVGLGEPTSEFAKPLYSIQSRQQLPWPYRAKTMGI
jgi:hypothetical protein